VNSSVRPADDVIQEICELYAQGITIIATLRYMGCHTRRGTSGENKIFVPRESVLISHINAISKR
jgi:hypothetical protein